MDRFQEILWDLGEEIDVPLHVDTNNACKIVLDDDLSIQLEVDRAGERLLIVAFVAEIPPGRFRENLLKETLKINAMQNRSGIFAYIEKINMLVLFHFLTLETVKAEMLADFLELFSKEAGTWRSSISMGTPLPSEEMKQPTKDPNLPFI